MSEHAWTSEHIAALVAGGLDAAETERAESHIRECAECETALRDARALDLGMATLFTAARPAAALEDRLIQTLRAPHKPLPISPSRIRWGWQRKLALGVAASVGLGIAGTGLSLLAGEDGLPMPGASRMQEQMRVGSFKLGADLRDPHRSDSMQIDNAIRSRDSSAKAIESADVFGESPIARDPERMAGEVTKQHWGARGDLEKPSDTELDIGLDPNKQFNFNIGRGESYTPPGRVPAKNDKAQWSEDGNGRSSVTESTKSTPPRVDKEKSLGDGDKLKASGRAGKEAALSPGSPPPQTIVPPIQVMPTPTTTVNDLHYYKPADNKPGTSTGGDVEPKLVSGNFQPNGLLNDRKRPSEGQPQRPGNANQPAPPPPPAPEAAVQRKIIRSGDIEFEIEAFDAASATVISLVDKIKGGFVATINSEKLPNGKVKGSIVVRVPPDKLDQFVLDLRRDLGKTGELKGQRIGSQDITKAYYDTESRLKAARYMEQRLLTMIKEGKGDIKQLLEAEKELGVWRTKIDEMEGEKRYFDNQVALSTLTITLAEKEIRAAAGLTESERVQTGIEVEDVEQAHRDALAAVTEAKGRVTRSEVKQLAAGQFNATLNFEVAPEQAGPLRDRLKQLGRTARLEVDRVQTAEGGGTPQRDSKVKRGDTIFAVQFYNLANIAPRETATLQLAAPDVTAAYRSLQDAILRAKGRIITSKLDENDRQNITAQLDFEVRRAEEGAIQTALAAAGETIMRNVNRAPDTENVTDAKVLFRLSLLSAARLRPRELVTLGIEVENVDATLATFAANVTEAKGRVIDSNIGRQANGKVVAALTIDVPLSAASGLTQKMMTAGVVKKEQRVRDPQAPEGQYATARIDVVVANKDLLVPKDEGLGAQVKKGFSYSANFLLVSLTWVIFGLCAILPWAVVGYVIYRIGRWLFRAPTAPTTAPAPQPPTT